MSSKLAEFTVLIGIGKLKKIAPAMFQVAITPDGIFSSTRVLHGTTNAVMYLQPTISSNLPDDLRRFVLLWFDDILVHVGNIRDHLGALTKLFGFFKSFNFKFHPFKSVLFARSARWCGHILSSEGIRFDPRRINGIRQIECPATGVHLQQFVCAMQWMRQAIPDFFNIIRLL